MADVNFPTQIIEQPNFYQQMLGNQQEQARTAVLQQQATGAALDNQVKAYQVGWIPRLQQLVAQYQQGGGNQPVPASADQSGVDEAPLTQGADGQYHIDKTALGSAVTGVYQQGKYVASPQLRAIAMAATNAGMPQVGQAYIQSDQAAYETEMQRRLLGANRTLAQVYTLQDAVKGGTGINALADIDKVAANNLLADKQKFGWSDDELNQHVGEWADAVGAATFPHTGRDVDFQNGMLFDKRGGRAVPGAEQAPLSAKDFTDLASKADEPTTGIVKGRETPMTRWEFDQAPSRTAWIYSHAEPGSIPGQPPGQVPYGSTGQPSSAPPQGVTTPAAGAVPQQQSRPGTPPAPTAAVPQAAPSATQLSPGQVDYIRSGPQRPTFNTGGSRPNANDTEQANTYTKLDNDFRSNYQAQRDTAYNTLVNVDRVQSLLAKNPRTGPGSSTYAAVGTFLQGLTGGQAADLIESNPAVYQLLQKELTRDQLDGVLKNFHGEGANVRLGAQESNMIIGTMSANPELSKGAIGQMMAWERSDANYKLAEARTALTWRIAGKDIREFDFRDRFPPPNNVQTNLGVPGSQSTARTSQPVPATRADASGYIAGRLYPGANGTKARYLGNGQWQPQ